MLKTTQQTSYNNALDGFQPYKLPFHLNQDDPIDGHRFQHRYLGVSFINNIEYTFFEIIELELSHSPEQEYLDETNLDGLATFALGNSPKGLPPKKRKRRRMIRHDLIFTVGKPSQLSHDLVFYLFPREAITESLTLSSPHKVMFSFLPYNEDCGCNVEESQFKTKLEEFAAVCSNSCKLSVHESTEKRICNMILSHVSIELLQVIKQIVHSYEIMCQNMMDLMKLHHERVTHHKSEIIISSETTIISTNQSEGDYQQVTKHNEDWSSSDEHSIYGKERSKEEEIEKTIPKSMHRMKTTVTSSIKKCLYCGSKSTPMWRRGPQGAGTLCNACGVKWKHGKILNGSESLPDQEPKKKVENQKKKKRSSSTKRNTKRKEDIVYYAVPAPKVPWEGQSTSSSISDSFSPLDSFSSPPSVDQDKRDLTGFIYDTERLSVYVGEEAVEAAALLTLLKRS